MIETIRPGVQFTPEAASAFRRADAQVLVEFGRHIDVNSTFRSWSDQMLMFTNWQKFVNGTGPRPAHSKAVHPSESFHVDGLALDSDDWWIPRIVTILAYNGFIRNRLHIRGEEHHFEYIRELDRNRHNPVVSTQLNTKDNDMRFFLFVCEAVQGMGERSGMNRYRADLETMTAVPITSVQMLMMENAGVPRLPGVQPKNYESEWI